MRLLNVLSIYVVLIFLKTMRVFLYAVGRVSEYTIVNLIRLKMIPRVTASQPLLVSND